MPTTRRANKALSGDENVRSNGASAKTVPVRARGPFVLPGADDDDDRHSKPCPAWTCRVCSIEDTPEWMIWNRHVWSGYRVGFGWRGATASVFKWHNDTVNIWSHLIGMVMFVALIVRTFQTTHAGVGLSAPPDYWVTGADVARVERIQYATRWRQDIRRDRDDLRAIDVDLHEKVLKGSAAGHAVHDVAHELLNVTHELAEHLETGEEAFKVDKRRMILRRSLIKTQKVLTALERSGGDDFSAFAEQCRELRTKLKQLQQHIEHVPDDPEPVKPVARWPMYLFLAGAVLCLSLSAVCHTYCCVGKVESEQMWRLDYFGIAVLIVSSFYPIVHYQYYCLPGFRFFYLTGVTTLGCLALIPTYLKAFQKVEYAHLRATLFVALGSFGIFPIFQQVFFVWRITPTPVMEAFRWEMAMAVGYISGAALYGLQIPERFRPGSFDHFGCSHNIFHFLVVSSAWFHYRASMIYLTWRDNYTCEADHELLLDWYHLGSHFKYPSH